VVSAQEASRRYRWAIPNVTDERSDIFYVAVLCYSSTQFYKTLHMTCNTYALIIPHRDNILHRTVVETCLKIAPSRTNIFRNLIRKQP